jgi:hypothetical protein
MDWTTTLNTIRDWSPLVGLIGFAVGLFGLYNTIRNLLNESKKVKAEKEQVQRLIEQLTLIESRLSTRPIGKFPSFLPAVTALVRDVKVSLKIFSSIPALGVFTAPDEWGRIRTELESKARAADIRVTVVTCSQSIRIKDIARQFPLPSSPFNSDLRPELFVERLRLFVKYYGSGDDPATISQARFHELLAKTDADILSNWRGIMTLKEIDEECPLWAWIRDDEYAVVGIANSTATSFAFSTQDAGMIKALLALYERYIE